MNERFRRLQILCFAILMSVVMVNVVLMILLISEGLQPKPVPPNLPIILFAIGLTLLVSSGAVKRAVFKRADAEGFDGDLGKVFSAYQTATILAFVLREAGGLIGFILALLTGNPWWSWGLGGAAVIAMIFDWPKREQLGP
jgi:tellurite resistance protein TehA-like permease